MTQKRVYISGKITGLKIEVAKEYFASVATELTKAGHVAINPFDIVPYAPEHTWEYYMLQDIEALFGCDAIVMLDNWHESRGAKIEHAIALHNGMEIYYPNMHKLLYERQKPVNAGVV